MAKAQISVGVIGPTGYTGLELVRLLAGHPKVAITSLVSRSSVGEKFSSLFPSFLGKVDLVCESLNVKKISSKVDVVFSCLPHHESMAVVKAFRSRGVRVLDLSADFRLKKVATYEQWYGKHTQKNLLSEAVYGLPETHRKEIKSAKLVAVPGCYPTSIILGLAPLLTKEMIDKNDIICDSKSGVSGAGRKASVETLFAEANESFKAYSIGCHRHTPEIEQELSFVAQAPVKVLFSPHLVPMDRGIHSTIYVKPQRRWSTEWLHSFYKDFYKKEIFVKVLDVGKFPDTKDVRETNACHLSIQFIEKMERIVICSVIDNLTKGASGQAVQCLNIMQGWPEKLGL